MIDCMIATTTTTAKALNVPSSLSLALLHGMSSNTSITTTTITTINTTTTIQPFSSPLPSPLSKVMLPNMAACNKPLNPIVSKMIHFSLTVTSR
ncbi:hypothetical protein BLOT_010497 [Blomia tropicalis]|nr:hypothetical protein BLOT_010497 [Blomia tropicalis]